MPKIVELAKKELKLPARLGYPSGLIGLERDSSWSTAAGLVLMGEDLISEDGFKKPYSFGRETFSKLKKIFKIFIP